LQLFHTRQRLRGVENPRAWIYRIATHVTLNKLKRQRRFAWLPWHTLENTPHFRWQAPDEEVSQRAAVENALAALPPHYRAPLLLYSEVGLSVREVAQALNIQENTVKVQLHRARVLFRQAYAQEDELSSPELHEGTHDERHEGKSDAAKGNTGRSDAVTKDE
jgi:RNA polymerase sigma-70 factor (ECF subfamily)